MPDPDNPDLHRGALVHGDRDHGSPGAPGPDEPHWDASELYDIGGWPAILGKLGAGEDLSARESAAALSEILAGEATQAQVAAFIFGLRCKGETVEELSGMLRAMLAVAETVPVSDELAHRLVDTCGTGGDRAGTINISTIAALVVAGAGVPVCKHGGRAASSRTGSADVLEALGVEIVLPPASVARCIEEAGMGFCFAPRYHPAMRHVVPTRRELGVPTAFNLLGPLANPGRVRYQLVGVGDGRVAERLAAVLASAGATRAWVVHGEDGLDELSTAAPSVVVECGSPDAAAGGTVALRTFVVEPISLGLRPARAEDLRGGDPAANAEAVRAVLSGASGPHRDIVLLNAAAALVVVGEVSDLSEGLARSAESVDSGRASRCLARLVECSRSEARALRKEGRG
ncbi:MAG TPA: anthranilate phosphoribosyltransferase [Acidimicrobiales bacterium]|nr:anthranilate phosphoribosyltransferase [Acidimicrobiales bacterium]